MRLVRCLCAGCGLFGLVVSAWAGDPFGSPPMLVSVTARSQYPNVTELMREVPASATASDSTPANYLQYEPQNVPLATEPPLINELPPVTETFESTPRELPPVVPYNTQFSVTWNAGSGDTLGIVDLDVREVLVFPRVTGFMITPGFASHLLNGPDTTDLPSALYDNWIEARWLKKVNDAWTFDLAFAPGLFTDYENTSDGAWRFPGRAMAIYAHSPELQLVGGLLYLNREDIAALPMAGLIWTPNDSFKAELLFPRPRLLRRLSGDESFSRWFYLGGEFGGNSWGIRRADGVPGAPTNDVVTYSVLRFFMGLETKKPKGFTPRIEAGFSFNRSIEYRSSVGNFDPDNAAMIRFGGSF